MIIVRYLIRETLKSQLAIFFILFLVFLSQKLIKVLAEATDGDIPASLVMHYVGLSMPSMGLVNAATEFVPRDFADLWSFVRGK